MYICATWQHGPPTSPPARRPVPSSPPYLHPRGGSRRPSAVRVRLAFTLLEFPRGRFGRFVPFLRVLGFLRWRPFLPPPLRASVFEPNLHDKKAQLQYRNRFNLVNWERFDRARPNTGGLGPSTGRGTTQTPNTWMLPVHPAEVLHHLDQQLKHALRVNSEIHAFISRTDETFQQGLYLISHQFLFRNEMPELEKKSLLPLLELETSRSRHRMWFDDFDNTVWFVYGILQKPLNVWLLGSFLVCLVSHWINCSWVHIDSPSNCRTDGDSRLPRISCSY